MKDQLKNLPLHHETYYFKFFEADLDEFGGKVFLQGHRNVVPDLGDMVAFKADFQYSRKIDSKGILKGLELKSSQDGLMIVKEHFNGLPLSGTISDDTLSLEIFLGLAMELVKLVDEVHGKGYVIKNLSSHNILVSHDFKSIKLSNVSQASDVDKTKDGLIIQNGWEESVVYLSPEQTGRIGRSTDYRSDYYALGVIFYEFLTSQVPFIYDSILELVHGHIAVTPKSPSELNPRVPELVSRIILKLLAKNAEDRYQSARGLLHDLKVVKENLHDIASVANMPLAAEDAAHKFNISERLYGREEELQILIDAFNRITKGPIEITYVYGYSGIGKTRLIEELHSQISREQGFFASGKFDQYHKETPYFAFTQAFNSLVLQLLSEENDKVVAWKRELLRALDDRGQVLVNIAADLEILLGPQEDVYDLGYKDNQERFIETVIDFLAVLDNKERPLVFFIDDLQWADTASLDLIASLIESRLKNILIIGAFRDNEVGVSHPLSLQIQHFKTNFPDRLSECQLLALHSDDINKLISDSLRLSERSTSALSNIITAKTEGNPFFIRQFFLNLVDLDLVFFNSELGKWDWHMDAILDLDVTDNVVDLVVKKIQKLDETTQRTISLAACIGNIWDYETLRIITQLSDQELSNSISKIIKLGFATPMGTWKEFFAELSEYLELFNKDEEEHEFKFLHDKIQQAAYSLIDGKDRVTTHLKIGELLLHQLDDIDIEEKIFDILDHLNFSLDHDLSDEKSLQLGKLNLRAGIKAKNSNAIETALQYLENAMKLFEFDQSLEVNKLALIERCECEYLVGHYDKAEQLFDTAIEEASLDFDKADILSRKMIVYENTQNHPEAITAGIQALKILGTDFPEEDIPDIVGPEFMEVQQRLKDLSIGDLLDNKRMTDETMLLTMKTLMNFWGPLYLLAKQNQLAWMVLRMVRLSTIHGNSIESAVAYAFYGYLISATMHEYDQGYRYGQLGIQLNSKINDKTLRSKVLVIAEGCISHWKDQYKDILPRVTTAYEIGLETNDIVYAGYAVTFMLRCHLRGDRNLNQSYEVYLDLLQFAIKIKHELTHQFCLAWMRFIVKMADIEPTAEGFGEWAAEEDHIAHMEALSEEKGVHYYLVAHHVAQSTFDYVLGNYQSGFNHAETILDKIDSITGLYEFGEHPIYRLLNLLGLAKNNPDILDKHREMFETNLAIIKKRAESSPGNFLSKYHLILAEKALVDLDVEGAKAEIKNVLEYAKQYNDQDVIGTAHERLSEIAFEQNEIPRGLDHINRSVMAFKKWGADFKVRTIKEKFSNLGELVDPVDVNSMSQSLEKHSKFDIDLETIVRASAVLTKEVRLENLLDRLLQLLIQNAGAQNAYLFISRQGQLILEASSKMKHQNETSLDPVPLEDVHDISKAIVRIVQNTGELISIGEGVKDEKYGHVLESELLVKSILCIPVKSGARIVAIIYMDNQLSNYAFPEERIALLEVLSGQIAISIDNALLYENLEQKVAERTLALADEKKKSDDLLLNILPVDVAETLKSKGSYPPRKHDEVSILFADFEGFTTVSQQITPEELVEMLDDCYKTFDAICEEFDVEKIKTIGDAYMCVSGLGDHDRHHTTRACMAGLKILEATEAYNSKRRALNLPYCNIRVGIHTGPVVAGVVGHRKFAFDIWGDSVNTASRMETYGQPGRLNVSHDCYEHIKNQFECESRGKVEVKHKGKIDMYFVNGLMK